MLKEMQRPLLMKVLRFHEWQKKVFFRFYHPVRKPWFPLFDACPLLAAPKIRMRLIPTDFMHGIIAFTGMYESNLTLHIAQKARKGGLFIDVGANAGYFSLIWAALNPSNTALAFEASPRNIQLLEQNIRSNNLAERIRVYPFALGKESASMPFDLGPSTLTGWGGVSLTQHENTINVSVRRLDDVIGDTSLIDVMKIDVEGADTWVIMGAEKLLLQKRIKVLYFEQNKTRLKLLNIGLNDAAEYLYSVGYHAEAISDATQDIVEWKALPEGQAV